jgi:zinc transport system ATP-binding protein
MDNVLEIQGLRVRAGSAMLLACPDLAVAPGTVHALVGPNGAGKSTLLRAVLGEVPFEGRIEYAWRRDGTIGYVPQRLELDAELPLTVAELLALGRQKWPICLGLTRATRARAGEALERVGLAHLADRRLGALSGGELQRVLLARAIVPAPELLLLDEPTAGVDADARAAVERALTDLRAQGVTALLVSHDADQIARLADRVTKLGGA